MIQEAIKELVAIGASHNILQSDLPGGVPAVFAPPGYQIVKLPVDESLNERPLRIKQTVAATDSDTFVRYFARFADDHSTIFASQKLGLFHGILDYHDDGGARWGCHQLKLALEKSDEWKIWTAQNAKPSGQEDFSHFIEDNLPDITHPDPARMLEIARTIQAKGEINAESAVRTNAGVSIRYNEVIQGKAGPAGEMVIPEEFHISIPVYVGSPLVTIKARFRWRINGGKLAMWYELWRLPAIERAAFESVRSLIASGTERDVMNGSIG